MVNFLSPKTWQLMTFLNPLDALIPKIPFSFFLPTFGSPLGPGVSLGGIFACISWAFFERGGAITIPTTPGGEGKPNLSKGVAPAGAWQPATRLSIGQRPKTCTARE